MPNKLIKYTIAVALLGAWTLLGGCAQPLDSFTDGESLGLPGDMDDAPRGPKQAWDYRNNPERLVRQGLNYHLSALPRQGRAETTPWASTYWPTYQDSTNVRWQGQSVLSPMEKFDVAFNAWQPAEGFMSLRPMTACGAPFDAAYYQGLGPAANWMSSNRGNGDFRDGVDNDGDGTADNCDADGNGDGLETWWGLCHAWAPAAILEPEPMHAVTYNGVRFEVGDLHALLITAYDENDALMLGGRCNARAVDIDVNGGDVPAECRDTNAGSMHVILGNLIGLNQRAFDFDRTWDFEVWNQPVFAYRVNRMDEVTAAQANTALGATGTTYGFNPSAVKLYRVQTAVDWITESHASREPSTPIIDRYTRTDTYDYILEVNADGKIIGGEWIGSSRTRHPDFLWLPTAAAAGSNPHVPLARVRELLALSRGEISAPTDGITVANTSRVAIPDDSAAGITSALNVESDANVNNLSVSVAIEHTWRGDLRVELRHGGRSVVLHNREGGDADDLSLTSQLADFDGMPIAGTWELFVSDNEGQDTGAITSFELTFHNVAAPSAGGTFENTTALAIPDNDTTGVSSVVNVDANVAVSGLVVNVDIAHTYIGDLIVELEHGGRRVTLHNRAGGGADDLVQAFELSDFDGMSAAGEWKLYVRDLAGQDVGSLRSWSLTVGG